MLAAALSASLTAALTLPAGLPPSLQIDGDLAEWSSRPPTFERFHQVAGTRHNRGGEDFSARVWIAFSKDGLAVAGEVKDDHVLFPTGDQDRLTADHAELWLAFPEIKSLTPRREECVPRWSSDLSQEDCEAWMKEGEPYRAFLRRLFVRQYSFSPLGVAEHFQTPAQKSFDLPFEVQPLPAEAKTAFRETKDGYTFEALLPPGALPASAQDPLTAISILVDFVDNDEGRVKQESFFSSSAHRRFGDRSTFQTVKLAEPVLFESQVPLAAHRLAGHSDRFFFPAAEVDAVYERVNPIKDSWREILSQKRHLPFLGRLDLSGKPLISWQDISLEIVAAGAEAMEDVVVTRYELMTVRSGSITGFRNLATRCEYSDEEPLVVKTVTWERPPGLHAAILCEGPQTLVHHGPCGSCPVTEVEIVSVNPDGKINRLLSDEVEAFNGYPVAFADASLAGTAFPANWDRLALLNPFRPEERPEWDESKPVKIRFPKRFDLGFLYWDRYSNAWQTEFITWNPAKRRYAVVKRSIPAPR